MNGVSRIQDSATRSGPAGSPFWFINDSLVMTGRELMRWGRQPAGLIIGWLFPVMTMAMFGLLFGGALQVPGQGSYFEFLMPGIFAMTMLFGLESTMISVNTDLGKGITDRLRSIPMSASAVLMGRCLGDMLYTVVGLAVIVGCGLVAGWQWHLGIGGFAAAVGLLLLLRFALLWLGIFLGLMAKSPGTVVAVQILVWPLSFLANVFVDPATMPAWLGAVAEWNPISSTAAAVRELCGNPGWGGQSWIAQNAVAMALVWPVAIILVFLPLSAWKYRKL